MINLCSDSILTLTIWPLNTLVGRVTGMNTEDDGATEPIQVVNYGAGGHYEPHVDYFGPAMEDTNQGDRVATMLYYLSDDIVGGKNFCLLTTLMQFYDSRPPVL